MKKFEFYFKGVGVITIEAETEEEAREEFNDKYSMYADGDIEEVIDT